MRQKDDKLFTDSVRSEWVILTKLVKTSQRHISLHELHIFAENVPIKRQNGFMLKISQRIYFQHLLRMKF